MTRKTIGMEGSRVAHGVQITVSNRPPTEPPENMEASETPAAAGRPPRKRTAPASFVARSIETARRRTRRRIATGNVYINDEAEEGDADEGQADEADEAPEANDRRSEEREDDEVQENEDETADLEIPEGCKKFSVTIVDLDADISQDKHDLFKRYVRQHTFKGMVARERGGKEGRLHLQCVVVCAQLSASNLSKHIRKQCGWPSRAGRMHVCSRELRNTGIHTVEGMLGYCSKDEGLPHFQYMLHNLSEAQRQAGVARYRLVGPNPNRQKKSITKNNFFQLLALFHQNNNRNEEAWGLETTVFEACRSGDYYPAAAWAITMQGSPIKWEKARAMWCMTVDPGAVTMQDVYNVFLERPARLQDLLHDSQGNLREVPDSPARPDSPAMGGLQFAGPSRV